MRHWFRDYIAASVVCGLVVATTCLPSARSEPQQYAVGDLPLLPVFSAAQDGPAFVADFKNETQQAVNIVKLIEASSIVLDGKIYKRQGIKFAGNSQLRPGSANSFKFDLGGYLLGSERKEFSESMKRWRWKSSLAPGKHTMLLNLGGKQYGPVSFVWDGDAPLLTK